MATLARWGPPSGTVSAISCVNRDSAHPAELGGPSSATRWKSHRRDADAVISTAPRLAGPRNGCG